MGAVLLALAVCALMQGMAPAVVHAQPPEVVRTPGGLVLRGSERAWSLAPWVGTQAMPPGAQAPQMALLVAQRDGRVLVAVRCLPAASARCPTWVGVFDTGGRLLHGRFTSPQLPIVSESAFGVAIDTGGEVEVREWATGEVITRFSIGTWTSAARILDDGTYVWNDGSVLHARTPSGQDRWQVPGAWIVGAHATGIVAVTQHDQRVLDPQSGATRCRRMVSGPLHEAHQGDLSLLIQHLCQTFSRPVGRLRGAVRIDGAAGSRLRIIVGDQTVTTDRAGWFSADFGAVGNVRVRLDTNHASGVGRRRCFMTRDERVELPEDGREAHVLVDIETFRPLCRSGGLRCGRLRVRAVAGWWCARA
jgi:hypothetical protein